MLLHRFDWLVLFWAVVTISLQLELFKPKAALVLRIVLAVLMLLALVAPWPT